MLGQPWRNFHLDFVHRVVGMRGDETEEYARHPIEDPARQFQRRQRVLDRGRRFPTRYRLDFRELLRHARFERSQVVTVVNPVERRVFQEERAFNEKRVFGLAWYLRCLPRWFPRRPLRRSPHWPWQRPMALSLPLEQSRPQVPPRAPAPVHRRRRRASRLRISMSVRKEASCSYATIIHVIP